MRERFWTGSRRGGGRGGFSRGGGGDTLPPGPPLATIGAERLWGLLSSEPHVPTFGALTGAQAVQMVRAGLKAIYLSGWQGGAGRTPPAPARPAPSRGP